jgi:sodium-dependent dicarboxylate transporter 2/3/5
MTKPQPVIKDTFTPAEQRFDRWRRKLGFVLAPVVFLAVLLYPFPSLTQPAHHLAAIGATTVVLWVTESIPLPATALLAAAACVMLRIAPASEVFAPFADPLIFLFIGSFIIAQAIFVHQLDRRLAERVLGLPWIAARPARVLLAVGGLTFLLSMWLSNTATAAMMFPIGLSIVARLSTATGMTSAQDKRYATALMLITAYSASIGGIATPVGTPPNVIALGYLRELTPYNISFFNWMLVAVPITGVVFLVMYVYFAKLCRPSVDRIPLGETPIQGKLTRAQRGVVIAFTVTVFLWILPGALGIALGNSHSWSQAVQAVLPESVVALVGAMLLFMLPGDKDRAGETRRVLLWSEAVNIDWGTILLFGGGLTLGKLLFQTGLADRIGETFKGLVSQRSPLGAELFMILVATLTSVVLTEFISNTAAASMLIPLVIATAESAQINPLTPTLGAAFGASLAFMLPVSTPPNAIVYGSGHVPVTRMIRYGLLLDVVGILLSAIGVYFLSSLIQ